MERRILIVEDDNFTGESLKILFTEKGFTVDLAANGQEAIESIRTSAYDLVITDLMMPLMDGLYLLNRIKDIAENLPVVIITAYGNIENMLTAYQFGAIEIINKPFETEELLGVVNEIFNR